MGQVTHDETCPGKGRGHADEGGGCRKDSEEEEEYLESWGGYMQEVRGRRFCLGSRGSR